MSTSPVQADDPREASRSPKPGIALCLSGGGYRAMLFHVGAAWRLCQLGYLPKLSRVSSVSGGSITAAVLGLGWRALRDASWSEAAFRSTVVNPIRELAGETIDLGAVFAGFALPGSISDRVAKAYRKHLFGHRTLQDLPSDAEGPRFVINATNVQSGSLFRFSRPYAADFRVGEVRDPQIELAVAVAASSAFPPVLSPCTLKLDPGACVAFEGSTLTHPPYTTEVILTDGGVYDNLGLETAWKRYETILVSDGGGKMAPEPEPADGWVGHTYRVLDLIDNQVRSLRKRQLIDSFQLPASDVNHRTGTYWGIWTDIEKYKLSDATVCSLERTRELAAISTRLAALDDTLQERLINWGYAVCDAGMRKHVATGSVPPSGLPYPVVGI